MGQTPIYFERGADMSIIATLILIILLGFLGIAIRRSRQAESAELNARLEDACHTSLESRIEAACGKIR
jgi:hypothetical protein